MTDLWLPSQRFVAAVVGAPKTGKTGSIAAFLNRGYRVIVAAFDPGADMLLNYVAPEVRDNLTILPFEDRRGFAGHESKFAVKAYMPEAFPRFVDFLNTGEARTTRSQGAKVVELGDSETWGSDTILVVDNVSSMCTAAFARLLHMSHRTKTSKTRKDWGCAADEVDDILIQLTSSIYSYHLIVLAHWYVQGPKEYEDDDKAHQDRVDYQNELREKMKDLIPVKQVPMSIGRVLSGNLLRHFPTVVWTEVNEFDQRVFDLVPKTSRDSGVPAGTQILPPTLPIETGLLTIFNAVTGGPA